MPRRLIHVIAMVTTLLVVVGAGGEDGVFGQVKLEKMKDLVEQQSKDPTQAEPVAGHHRWHQRPEMRGLP